MSELNVIFPPSKRKQMQMLRDQGLRYREIAEQFGCTIQYVAIVCGKSNPSHFVPVGSSCAYPNLREWMNKNKVSRNEFIRRMGLTIAPNNLDRFGAYIRGEAYPRKNYIDKMLEVTGLTYEELFKTEDEDG